MNNYKEDYTRNDISTIMTSFLPENIFNYFSNLTDRHASELYDYLLEKYIIPGKLIFEAKNCVITLESLISYLLWDTFDNENGPKLTEREAMDHYTQKKRNRKKYLHKIVKQEYSGNTTPQNPMHLHNGYIGITNPYCMDKLSNLNLSHLSEQAYFDQEYKKVEEWYKASSSAICDYPYYHTLSAKKQIEDFLIDLGYNIFSIICNEFFRNRCGIVTRSADLTYKPSSATENTPAIVNWQGSSISVDDLRYEAQKNNIVVYELIPSDTGTVRIIVDIIHNVDCSSKSKAATEIERIKSAYQSGARISHLDALDHSIITALINNINFSIATGRENILITFPELAKDVYGSNSPLTLKKSKQLFTRLQKLQKMNISFSEQNTEGIPIYGRGIDFFNFEYSVSNSFSKDCVPSPVSTTKDIDISGNADIANIDLLVKDHYNNMLLSITPSEYLRSQWLNGMHTVMSTKAYKSISSQKGKLLYQLLLEERLKIYPQEQAKLTLMYLKSRIRITSGTETRFKNDIKQELSNLITNRILVKDFKVSRTSFDITFLPLDDNERILYKLDNANIPPAE